jgi:hypothetical protein
LYQLGKQSATKASSLNRNRPTGRVKAPAPRAPLADWNTVAPSRQGKAGVMRQRNISPATFSPLINQGENFVDT